MKTAELEGAQLDLWVAKAVYEDHAVYINARGVCEVVLDDEHTGQFEPSTNWEDGGKIIEREKIAIGADPATGIWLADDAIDELTLDSRLSGMSRGPTPLVAAMRAYVRRKFGDEVAG